MYFSYYGYKTSSYIVPDTLEENRYSIIHMLQQDTINLPEVTVYPWPSREDFARFFVLALPKQIFYRKGAKVRKENNSFSFTFSF